MITQARMPTVETDRFVDPPEGNPRIKVIPMKRPWDVRICYWAERQIMTPHRLRRFVYWLVGFPFRWYQKARSCVSALTSDRVDQETYNERCEICWQCPELLGAPRAVKTYCGACDCGRWYLARVRVRNWFRKAYCTQKYHPGEYPSYGCAGCNADGVDRMAFARGRNNGRG